MGKAIAFQHEIICVHWHLDIDQSISQCFATTDWVSESSELGWHTNISKQVKKRVNSSISKVSRRTHACARAASPHRRRHRRQKKKQNKPKKEATAARRRKPVLRCSNRLSLCVSVCVCVFVQLHHSLTFCFVSECAALFLSFSLTQTFFSWWLSHESANSTLAYTHTLHHDYHCWERGWKEEYESSIMMMGSETKS